VGSPSTQKALDMAMMAQKIGVQGILAVTPYYVKPTSAGVMAHFKQIHDGVSLPMIVYSNPRRTGFEIEESLLDDILTLPRVIGIKDSTSDLQRIEKLGKKFQNTSFEYTCGEDSMIQEFLKHGSNTWISVISNLYPNR
jgi:4-hydroxy-tetrahydrodipicolinate synthase